MAKKKPPAKIKVVETALTIRETSFSLAEFMDKIQEAVDEIPPPFLSSTTVEILSKKEYHDYGGGSYCRGVLEISYRREETDAERDKRIETGERMKLQMEERELEELQRLQAKYNVST